MRSVLCTRIAIPAADNVSNRVLRAVLGGDTDEMAEAIKRKSLKGVMVALTADNRYDSFKGFTVGCLGKGDTFFMNRKKCSERRRKALLLGGVILCLNSNAEVFWIKKKQQLSDTPRSSHATKWCPRVIL